MAAATTGVGFDAMKKVLSHQRCRIGQRRSAHRLRSTRVVCHDAAAIQDARDQQPNTFPTESEKGLWHEKQDS